MINPLSLIPMPTHRGESSREFRRSPRPSEPRETRPPVRPPPTTEPIPLHKIVISSALKRPQSPRIQDRLSRVQPSTSQQAAQQQPSTSSRMFSQAPAHMRIRPESVIVTPQHNNGPLLCYQVSVAVIELNSEAILNAPVPNLVPLNSNHMSSALLQLHFSPKPTLVCQHLLEENPKITFACLMKSRHSSSPAKD